MRLERQALLLILAGCASAPAAAVTPPAVAVPASASKVEAPSPPPAAPRPPPPPTPQSPGWVSIGEIAVSPGFDPKVTILSLKPDLLRCYNETRSLIPDLHGKLTLSVHIDTRGVVTSTEAAPGGSANDEGLLACIADAMQATRFPQPNGNATILVSLVFRR